jgi:hypothetical protein
MKTPVQPAEIRLTRVEALVKRRLSLTTFILYSEGIYLR